IINILKDPERITDSLLSHKSVQCQASPDEWSRAYGIEPRPSPEARDYKEIAKRSEDIAQRIAGGATREHIMIDTAARRQQAVEASKRIAVQGEGRGIETDSHFWRFRSIMEDFLELREQRHGCNPPTHPKWNPPTHPMAVDPLIPWPAVPDD